MSANDYNRGYCQPRKRVFNYFNQKRPDRNPFHSFPPPPGWVPPNQPHNNSNNNNNNNNRPGDHHQENVNNIPNPHTFGPNPFNPRHRHSNNHHHNAGQPKVSAHGPRPRYPFGVHDPPAYLAYGAHIPASGAGEKNRKEWNFYNDRPGHLPPWQAPPRYEGPRYRVPYSGYDGEYAAAQAKMYATTPVPPHPAGNVPNPQQQQQQPKERSVDEILAAHRARRHPHTPLPPHPQQQQQQQGEEKQKEEEKEEKPKERSVDEILASHRVPPRAYIIHRPSSQDSISWLASRLWRLYTTIWCLLLRTLRAFWALPAVHGTLVTAWKTLQASFLRCGRFLAFCCVNVAHFLWEDVCPWILWAMVRGAVTWWLACVGWNMGVRWGWWKSSGTVDYYYYYYVLRKTPLYLGNVSQMVVTGPRQGAGGQVTTEIVRQAAQESTSSVPLVSGGADHVVAQAVMAARSTSSTKTSVAAAAAAASDTAAAANATSPGFSIGNSTSSILSATLFTLETCYAWLGARNEGREGSSATSWGAVTDIWESFVPPAAASTTG